MSKLLLVLVALVLPTRVFAAPILFGVSDNITLQPGEDVFIDAVIRNSGSVPLEFGCGRVTCGGPDFGVGASSGEPLGLNPLRMQILNAAGTGFYEQFAGLVLAPGDTFLFHFARVNFDPAVDAVLHPTFSFRFEGEFGHIRVSVQPGVSTSFGPLAFVPVQEVPVPVSDDSSTLLLFAIAVIGSILTSPWRR